MSDIYGYNETNWRPIQIDEITRYLIAISEVHHKSHEGDAYTVTDVDLSVDNAGPKYWRITTPDTATWAHFQFEADASGPGLIEIFRTPTEDDPAVAGTALVAYNDNENSANTATTAIKYDPVFTSDGTRIWHSRIGVTGNPVAASGGKSGSRREKILKQGTTYTVKFTPDGDGESIWISFYWYENTNENV